MDQSMGMHKVLSANKIWQPGDFYLYHKLKLKQFFEVVVIIRLDGPSLAAQSKALLNKLSKIVAFAQFPFGCFCTEKKAPALEDHRHKVPVV
jgi:hypothetical protein